MRGLGESTTHIVKFNEPSDLSISIFTIVYAQSTRPGVTVRLQKSE